MRDDTHLGWRDYYLGEFRKYEGLSMTLFSALQTKPLWHLLEIILPSPKPQENKQEV